LAIQFTTSVSDHVLHVKASGYEESLGEVQAYSLAILQASITARVDRVLCDELDLEHRLGTFEIFRAAEFLSARVPPAVRISVVCDPRFLADARFWETVAVNRGLRVRVFTDVESAHSWLTAGSSRELMESEGSPGR
jgi:hypothetical protein